jgi:hypothetical protein
MRTVCRASELGGLERPHLWPLFQLCCWRSNMYGAATAPITSVTTKKTQQASTRKPAFAPASCGRMKLRRKVFDWLSLISGFSSFQHRDRPLMPLVVRIARLQWIAVPILYSLIRRRASENNTPELRLVIDTFRSSWAVMLELRHEAAPKPCVVSTISLHTCQPKAPSRLALGAIRLFFR